MGEVELEAWERAWLRPEGTDKARNRDFWENRTCQARSPVCCGLVGVSVKLLGVDTETRPKAPRLDTNRALGGSAEWEGLVLLEDLNPALESV